MNCRKLTSSGCFALLILAVSSCFPDRTIDDQYETFARRIIQSLRKPDIEKLKDLLNPDPATAEIFQRLHVSDFDRSDDNSRQIKLALYEYFANRLKRIGTADLQISRQYSKGGVRHVVLTIVTGPDINFIDFTLGDTNGKIQVTDFYDYNANDTFLNLFVAFELVKITGLNLTGPGYRYALRELARAQQFANANDYRRAWITFNRIEYKLQLERPFQETRLSITKQLGDSVYAQALAEVVHTFRSDDRLRISRSLDYYRTVKDHSKALVTLDSLITLVGRTDATAKLRKELVTNGKPD